MVNSNLAIYTSHDSSIAVRSDVGVYHVIELERVAGQRYYSLAVDREHSGVVLPKALEICQGWADIARSSYLSLHPKDYIEAQLLKLGHAAVPGCNHHDAHAACAFYQSPYDKATVVTYDGGGHDLDGRVQYFCLYSATREGGCVRKAAYPTDLGTAYIRAGTYVDEIKRSSHGNWLSWPGKLMALAGYGKFTEADVYLLQRYMLDGVSLEEAFEPFRHRQLDWCAAAQAAFEATAVKMIQEWAPDKSMPLCLSGGCALNVQVNQVFRDLGYEVFVPPNPNDSGLTLGMLLAQDRPRDQVVCTYNGVPWPGGEEAYPTISLEQIVDRLKRGQIVGYIEGDSELGPRALGHRSILCRGDLPHARARLNAIKGREWYRPVSPVLLADHSPAPSPFMSFAESDFDSQEWVHVDGTARVQRVTKEACPNLYAMVSAIGPLINTSLNLKGRPLCNDLEHALTLLRETSLDCLVVNGHLIEK